MTTPDIPDRDRATVDALVADRYLDALLGIADPWTGLAPGRMSGSTASESELEPAVRDAARVLRRALVRIHPSFRFEERLAARLTAAARGEVPGGRGTLIRLPAARLRSDDAVPAAGPTSTGPDATLDRLPPIEIAPPDPWLDAVLAGSVGLASDGVASAESRLAAARRPLLVGGALTSAALSLAGVAWVAWRVARPSPLAELEGTV